MQLFAKNDNSLLFNGNFLISFFVVTQFDIKLLYTETFTVVNEIVLNC